jgi:3-methyl-2-oxobutanoate hydroxymethyltransferase
VTKVTTLSFRDRKARGDSISMLTAYDFPTAQLLDEAGVDAILVGDSVGMAVMGYSSTLPVTVDDILHHTRMVARGTTRSLVVADMPFLSYQVTAEEAVRNAGRLVAEGGAQAVKLEGPVRRIGAALSRILDAGIPVMGHLGLTPQSVHQFGGFRVQGREAEARAQLIADAKSLEEAGCFAIVLECIPRDLATEISNALSIPTIGIGAGAGCDGQILVLHDILGWGKARFAHTFSDVRSAIGQAASDYVNAVNQGDYPAEEHGYE